MPCITYCRGISVFFEKIRRFSSLHMKGFDRLFDFEKCFGFFKMDKKNVQIWKVQIFYEKVVNCDDKKFLASGCQKNNFQIVTINFKIFLVKLWTLAIGWQYLAMFSIAKIAKNKIKNSCYNIYDKQCHKTSI